MLDGDEVQRGIVDAGWLDRLTVGEASLPERHARIALLQAAIEVYDAEHAEELEAFFASAARMRPTCRADVGRQVEFGYRGHRYQFRVYRPARDVPRSRPAPSESMSRSNATGRASGG